MGSDEMTTQEQLDNAEDTINTLYARIDAIEATERELREAVRLLAEEAHTWRTHTDENYYTNALQSAKNTDSNPIAAEAVRKAGG